MELRWHIGDVVRKLREQQRPKWTQGRLAKEAGLNKATIVSVENNDPRIRRDTYEAIARAFKVSLVDLFSVPGQEVQRTLAAGPSFPSTGTDDERNKR